MLQKLIIIMCQTISQVTWFQMEFPVLQVHRNQCHGVRGTLELNTRPDLEKFVSHIGFIGNRNQILSSTYSPNQGATEND